MVIDESGREAPAGLVLTPQLFRPEHSSVSISHRLRVGSRYPNAGLTPGVSVPDAGPVSATDTNIRRRPDVEGFAHDLHGRVHEHSSGYVMSQWVPVVSPEMKSAALIQH